MRFFALAIVLILVSVSGASAEQCGWQAGGALCPNKMCCSEYGYCGSTEAYCGEGCQSQCDGGGGDNDISSIISWDLFNELLKHRNDSICPAKGFYFYDAFVYAAKSFDGFGTTGDDETRKREIAAFLAQTSHETTGGWPDAPDGPYAWGYCFKEEQGNPGDYCVPSQEWPCVPGKKYYGRGPIQLSYNYNYGPAGQALDYDLLSYPDIVATNPVTSFQTALWFWMTPQPPKPSCHDVITGQWKPSNSDIQAGRLPGYGVLTNIINGGIECGQGSITPQEQDRIGFYKRYCDIYELGYGDNLNCSNQRPFGWGLKSSYPNNPTIKLHRSM